jgi:hypothetical protein
MRVMLRSLPRSSPVSPTIRSTGISITIKPVLSLLSHPVVYVVFKVLRCHSTQLTNKVLGPENDCADEGQE